MGNELEKEFNIKDKPLKLPGSYNFLRFAQHPSRPLSLLVVKHPHRAAPMSSTLILPLDQVRPLASDDQLAICPRCLPLCLVKPKSETQLRILMHRILKAGSELGRCFFHMGRVMLWCEQKRGLSSISPEELQFGKPHPQSKVFTSGIALINFLHCIYQPPQARKEKKKDKKSKSQLGSGGGKDDETVPSEVRLLFDPKDRREYEEGVKNMDANLRSSAFWQAISEGLRELLLNMVSPDPNKRLAFEQITEIAYFIGSKQLRIYSVLADQLEGLSPRKVAVFLQALEVLLAEGLTLEQVTLDDFVAPLLTYQVLNNPKEGREDDWLLPLLVSVLLELPKPPVEVIMHGFIKAHPRNRGVLELGLRRGDRIKSALPFEDFQRVLGRCMLGSFEREELLGLAISYLPGTLFLLTHQGIKKELEFQLIERVLQRPPAQIPAGLLLQGLKATILMIREGLISSPLRLEGVTFNPEDLSLEVNLHALYLWGLLIEQWPVGQLLQRMMPKLSPYLGNPEVPDPLFVVAKRCLERVLQRLHEQRRIKAGQLVELQKDEAYFEAVAPPSDPDIQTKRVFVKKEVDKHQLQELQWVADML